MLCRIRLGVDKPLRTKKISQQDLIKSDCDMIDPDGRGSIPFVSRGGGGNMMHIPPASVWRIVYDRRAEENLKG
jgi:hypothetical protein